MHAWRTVDMKGSRGMGLGHLVHALAVGEGGR